MLLVLLTLQGGAQEIGITGFGGYTFQDRLDFGNAYGYLKSGGHWGLSVEGIGRSGVGLELLYQQQNTKLPAYSNNGDALNQGKEGAAVSYIMLNGLGYVKVNKMIRPYGGIGMGVAVLKAKSSGNSETKMALDAKLGVKIKAAKNISFKVQTQLFYIVKAEGDGFIAGAGTGYVFNSHPDIFQFGLTGGICFDLNRAPRLGP